MNKDMLENDQAWGRNLDPSGFDSMSISASSDGDYFEPGVEEMIVQHYGVTQNKRIEKGKEVERLFGTTDYE